MNGPLWYLTKDGDRTCAALYREHYSSRKSRRTSEQFVGPGEHIVLRTGDGDAVFVWRNYIDDTEPKQEGVECSLFRNIGQSDLPSLSDRLVPSLISHGLVKGTTPRSIRKELGAPIRASVLWPLDGGNAE